MFTADRLRVLAADECLTLLRRSQHHVGRLAFNVEDGPTILPVNYIWDAGRVVIRSAPGAKLDAAVDQQRVAFEIDSASSAEPRQPHAWSVVVRGRAGLVSDPTEEDFLRLSGLDPDAGGLRVTFVVINADEVSGRRY